MLDAVYGEGTSLNSNANRFTEKVTGYDKKGNILVLQRYGQTSASGYGLIDNLTFTLDGNQLNRVDDAVKQADEYAKRIGVTRTCYDNSFMLQQLGITNLLILKETNDITTQLKAWAFKKKLLVKLMLKYNYQIDNGI